MNCAVNGAATEDGERAVAVNVNTRPSMNLRPVEVPEWVDA